MPKNSFLPRFLARYVEGLHYLRSILDNRSTALGERLAILLYVFGGRNSKESSGFGMI